MKFLRIAAALLLTASATAAFAQINLADATSNGTGFLVSPNGYIITNYHVIKDSKIITIYQKNQQVGKVASVIRTDKTNDIAVLKIACENCSFVNTKPSSSVRKGDKVYALGYPEILVQGQESKLTDGVISSLSGIKDQPVFFQISNPIQHGNSGGPLFLENGDVIGIVSAGIFDLQNVNYAVKSNYYIELINSIDSGILKPSNSKNGRKLSDVIAEIDKATVLILNQDKTIQKKVPPKQITPPAASTEKPPSTAPTPPAQQITSSISKLPPCIGSDTRLWNSCFGETTYPNGNTYRGEFRNGMRECYGILRVVAIGSPDQNNIRAVAPGIYIGQFKNNRINGRGTWKYDNGQQFEGEFVDNVLVKKY